MAYWLDYSAAELSGTIIKNAGYTGAIRYIDSVANLGRKHTSLAEYRSLKAAGLGVRLVMQTTTTASAGGFSTGVDHAKRAKNGADYLGYGGVIYFTNDRVELPSPAEWQSYLLGAMSVLGKTRVGAYGFGNAMDAADRAGIQHFWQAGRRSDVRSFVQIWQDNNTQVTVGGITCDRNLILKPLVEESDMEATDKVTDSGPGRWDHTWLNTQQVLNNADFGLKAIDTVATAARSEATNAKVAANNAVAQLSALTAKVAELSAKVDGIQSGTVNVDVDAFVAQLVPNLSQALRAAEDRAARDGDPTTGPVS